MGFVPYSGALYAMVLGGISEEEKSKSESQVKVRSLQALIHDELHDSLPDYMLPHAYAWLDKLPLSANGKLAAHQLPPIELKKIDDPPVTESEKQLAVIWADLLSLPLTTINRTDNFFALGGNSLLAMQLVRQLNREFSLTIKLTELYKQNTLNALAIKCISLEKIREEGVM